MRNLKTSFVIGFFVLLLSPSFVSASLLVVKNDGEVTWNVLSEEDNLALDIPTHSYLEVKKAAEVAPSPTSVVTLSRQNGKISLLVDSGNERRELDVTNWQEDLLEIEERAETQKLKVGIEGEKFSLEQEGIIALTSFPVTVDSKTANLSVQTSSGQKFLSIFPREAVDALLRTKLVNKIVNPRIEVVEENRQLQYVVAGEKVFNILGLLDYSIPITSYISASTGEILSIDSPTWFKYVKFLFV
ncbi:hypothetical protein A3A52_02870 [Candidatus Woesebacteria bacterium RIFCSPLOWO2_01_FULL_39_14]|uniref:AMIN domain-containing protein n=1 Tax=Candidatus Woesebacteria bacterium RIFCSPLOWO2_01_FULL_39_14 TaxID=1802518 RepID=A0A1F8BDW2_9BACT|nr:MAG: hypothetical protein A3A52_02870 [Candidatus Woesebacteria bacterium RIFCSPLOWO2_01_FULL_39_14]